MRRKMTMMDTLYWLNMCENYENYENDENDDDDDDDDDDDEQAAPRNSPVRARLSQKNRERAEQRRQAFLGAMGQQAEFKSCQKLPAGKKYIHTPAYWQLD